jgi:hypothetical protein
MNAVWQYFKETYTGNADPAENGLSAFKRDWTKLTDIDRAQLRGGIENETLNY